MNLNVHNAIARDVGVTRLVRWWLKMVTLGLWYGVETGCNKLAHLTVVVVRHIVI